jgi:hypothetical protein
VGPRVGLDGCTEDEKFCYHRGSNLEPSTLSRTQVPYRIRHMGITKLKLNTVLGLLTDRVDSSYGQERKMAEVNCIGT